MAGLRREVHGTKCKRCTECSASEDLLGSSAPTRVRLRGQAVRGVNTSPAEPVRVAKYALSQPPLVMPSVRGNRGSKRADRRGIIQSTQTSLQP
jgi:hypothetical protein